MFDFLNPMKLYIGAASAAVLAALYGIWQYRGFKIDKLETELDASNANAATATKVHENEINVIEYEAANKEAAKNAAEPITEFTEKGEVHAKDPAGTFYNI